MNAYDELRAKFPKMPEALFQMLTDLNREESTEVLEWLSSEEWTINQMEGLIIENWDGEV